MGGGFEVHNVQRILWISQHFVQSMGLPRARRKRGEQGTGGEKLEKVAALSQLPIG
jgi:hypothetical protein